MNEPFKIVIVGGGSAGWMTAAYLAKALERDVRISLIESPDIGTVGVGEATFSTIRLFFDFLGLREHEWMPHCNASYKLAVKFVNWNGEGRHFYHPFQRFERVRGASLAEWWLQLNDGASRFDYDCFTVPAICDAQRSPCYLDGRVFDSRVNSYLSASRSEQAVTLDELRIQYPYAYHFDASLLARFLSNYAQRLGVKRIGDEVLGVEQTEEGHIRALHARNHGALEADLFVDCTGFRGLLINQTLHEPFISFESSLPCDRAVAMQIPSDPDRGMNPYTQATALSAGWVWNIPLFHRTGTGYVYSSAFISPEQAEREFRQHLGPRADDCPALHIKMRVGRNRNSWVRNCVAIGLSSAFVEPLESTGIFFIQNAIEQLVANLPKHPLDGFPARLFNQSVADCMDGIREFLTVHYIAGAKRDTAFWKATKEDLSLPGSLGERLDLWSHRLPTNDTIRHGYHGFESYSYAVMLLGLGRKPDSRSALLDHVDESEARRVFEAIRDRSRLLVSTLPSQREFLESRYPRRAAVTASRTS